MVGILGRTRHSSLYRAYVGLTDMDTEDMKISSILSYVLISTLIELLNEVPYLTSAQH